MTTEKCKIRSREETASSILDGAIEINGQKQKNGMDGILSLTVSAALVNREYL